MSQRKRLVVCFDGTWNSADTGECETNVARLARSIHATQTTEGVHQIVLYLRGVGTTGHAVERLLSGASGRGVDDNIRSAYMFLAQNYLPARDVNGTRIEADEIFLFGFSRGAFTARSLGGFISTCGLLLRQKLDLLPEAWAVYRKEDTFENFCTTHSRDSCHHDVKIAFMGVWDTVGALGVPSSVLGTRLNSEYQFHNTTPSRNVLNAYHALAIDEHRDEFVPTLWTGEAPEGCHIEQRWFAGAHSDVGGGYKDRRLADVPLNWMADMAARHGLKIDKETLLGGRIPDPLAPQHESRRGVQSFDRLMPTFRLVCGKEVDVSFYERLYRPLDPSGVPLRPINEVIDPSVAARIGRQVELLYDDGQSSETVTYAPRNL